MYEWNSHKWYRLGAIDLFNVTAPAFHFQVSCKMMIRQRWDQGPWCPVQLLWLSCPCLNARWKSCHSFKYIKSGQDTLRDLYSSRFKKFDQWNCSHLFEYRCRRIFFIAVLHPSKPYDLRFLGYGISKGQSCKMVVWLELCSRATAWHNEIHSGGRAIGI